MSKNISNAQAKELIKKGAKIIDIREPKDFWNSHIPTSMNININDIESIETLISDKTEKIIVICSHGIRSLAIAESLTELGYINVFNLSNGYESFRKFEK